MKPSAWDASSEEDKAEMVAFEVTLGDMRAYEEHLEEQKRIAKDAAAKV